MSNIKYRQLVGNKWHYWGFLPDSFNDKICFVGPVTNQMANPIHCQFTGLTDKNGVEIYEGDVVKLNDCLVAEVKFIGCGFAVITKSIYANREFDLHAVDAFEEVEVLGNVHQHDIICPT